MARRFIEFELSFTQLATDSYSVRVRTPDGTEGTGTFQIPPDSAPIPGTSTTFGAALAELQAEYPDTDEMLLSGLGELLFGLVFQGMAANAYNRAQGANQDDPQTLLRLKLNIPEEDGRLAGLPWELLKAPQDMAALVLGDASVIRYLPLLSPTPTVAATLPLRVLLTGAVTPPAPDVTRELAAIRESLQPLEERGLIVVTLEEHLTTAKLQRHMSANPGYHIWHFVGHGVLAADGRSRALCFEDDRGDKRTVTAQQLSVLLNRTAVQLIVLSACNSASFTQISPARGVASALVKARVPAVVAMQFTAPESATRVFAAKFYEELVGGETIDSCVTEGRKAVLFERGSDVPDWALPVVYTRAPDGKLFTLPATSEDRPPAANQQPAQPVTTNSGTSRLAAELVDVREQIDALAPRVITSRKTQRDLLLQVIQLGEPYTPPATRSQIDALDKTLPGEYQQLAELYEQLVRLSAQANAPDLADVRADAIKTQITAREVERDVCQRRVQRLGTQFGRKDVERIQTLNEEIKELRTQLAALP